MHFIQVLGTSNAWSGQWGRLSRSPKPGMGLQHINIYYRVQTSVAVPHVRNIENDSFLGWAGLFFGRLQLCNGIIASG